MLHIYTGDGKGKTTAATGLLVRALGNGMKCGYFSFLKEGSASEINILKRLDNLTIFEFPDKVPFSWNMTLEEKGNLKDFYCKTMQNLKEYELDLVVLDEAISAVCLGFIDEKCIIELKDKCEVILTGRGECENIFKIADYITEMKKHKHPFDKGINARKGIEY